MLPPAYSQHEYFFTTTTKGNQMHVTITSLPCMVILKEQWSATLLCSLCSCIWLTLAHFQPTKCYTAFMHFCALQACNISLQYFFTVLIVAAMPLSCWSGWRKPPFPILRLFSMIMPSLVPRPPPFSPSICIHNNTWKHSTASVIIVNVNGRLKMGETWEQ